MDCFSTSRLKLRRLTATDFANMRLLESDPLVMRFTPSRVPQSEDQTTARLESQIARTAELGHYGIWVAERTNEFVGWFMLLPSGGGRLELGFMIERSAWGKGLATEAARALLSFAFSDSLIAAVSARTDEENISSQKVLAKLGFRWLETSQAEDKILRTTVRTLHYELIRPAAPPAGA
jgi:RimJ/RimL family protein N-acetyltransferase